MIAEEDNALKVEEETKKKRPPQPSAGDDGLDPDGLDFQERELTTESIREQNQEHTEAKAYWEERFEALERRIMAVRWNSEDGVEKARMCLFEAEAIPYLTQEMKDVVTNLRATVGVLSNPLSTEEVVEQLSAEKKETIKSFSGAGRELCIEMVVQESKISNFDNFMASALKLQKYLFEVWRATFEVDRALKSLSGLSQARGATLGNVGTGTLAAIEREIKRHKAASVQVKEPKRIKREDQFRQILDDPQDLDTVLELKVSDDKLTQKLRFVSNALEQYLSAASFLNHDAKLSKSDYNKKVGKDMESLHKRVCESLCQKEYEKDTTIGGTKRSSSWLSCLPFSLPTQPQPCAPGAHAFEVEGTQQWLSVVTRLIGECLHPPYQRTSTPEDVNSSQVNISPVRNRFSAGDPEAPGRPKRRVDMMLTKEGRHAVVIFDDSLQLGGVEKPGSRDGQGPGVLFHEGTNQILSHAAMSVDVGFNFAGAGVPTHETMFVVNMAAIQVLRLDLEKVGTPDVRLVLYKSKLHPLLSVAQYDRWAATAKPARQKDFADFKEKLYGAAFNKGIDSEGMPSGFPVLCSLMQKRRKELLGPAVEAEHNILGDVLGTGSFSVVFRHNDNPKVAVKLSRYGNSGDLHHESKILGRLRGSDDASPHVTELVESLTTLDVTFQGVKWPLPVLKTKPVGLSSLVACAREMNNEERAQWLQSVLDGLVAALKFIHNKNIMHRDINPSNVVMCDDGNGNEIPVLNDFSIAFFTGDDKKAIGFSGTVNYTHREVFTMYPNHAYKPDAKHDHASLGFTMATFANCGSSPWSAIVGFPKTLTKFNIGHLEEQMGARLDSAIALVSKLQSQELASKIETLLLEDRR